ncbi:hypothetical protein L7F22_001350 [Adiantum nelumboides]|nr:hypothetical protein [Adiantum nelumboides]
MANQHATSIITAPASLVGNAFVNRYYRIIHQTPHLGYRFYMEDSRITRAEPLPEATVEPTTTLSGINDKIMSWDYRGMRTEIMTVDSQESLAGRVLVMVTGALYNAGGLRRMFVQTFVLVPQEKRYYIYNDIFRFLDGGAKSNQQLASQVANNIVNVHDLPSSTALDQGIKEGGALPQPPERSDIGVNSDVHTSECSSFREPDAVPAVEDHIELPSRQIQVSNPLKDTLVENSPVENITQSQAEALVKPSEYPEALAESTVDVPKKSYASILRLQKESMKGTGSATSSNASKLIATHVEQSASSGASQAVQSTPQASLVRLQSPEPIEEMLAAESEGDIRSVYVKSLPLNVTVVELEQEFSKFGLLKPGGINLRNQRIGVCFAFIEFLEASSAQSATEASPLNMNGRQVYIELKKIFPSRGGRGRLLNLGRGYQNDGMRGRSYYGNGRGISKESERDFGPGRGRGILASRGGYGGANFNMANTFRRQDTQNGGIFRPIRRAGNQMGRNGPLARNGIMVAAA